MGGRDNRGRASLRQFSPMEWVANSPGISFAMATAVPVDPPHGADALDPSQGAGAARAFHQTPAIPGRVVKRSERLAPARIQHRGGEGHRRLRASHVADR